MSFAPAAKPTMYFVGVTTGSSLIMRVFPRWAELLELGDVELKGIDLPLRAGDDAYREVVEFIGSDELSLGALVTTHKLDLYAAASDRFDQVAAFARVMRETSSISKRDGQLCCDAKDPISSALALDAFVPAGHWAGGGAAFLAGAGGAATAIAWALATRPTGDAPSRIVVSDIDDARLRALGDVMASVDRDVPLDLVPCETAADNDAIVAQLPEGSLVVNATGLGKDRPGSPLTDDVVFPAGGLAWELNYRGDLVFLDQARAASALKVVEDGWTYFIHGWTQVIADVFHVEIPTSGPGFDRLVAAADDVRAGASA